MGRNGLSEYGFEHGPPPVPHEYVHRNKIRNVLVVTGLTALLVSGIVAAISITNHTHQGILGETYNYESALFSVQSGGQAAAVSDLGAAGTTNALLNAIEMTAGGSSARTTINSGNWIHQATIKEAGANTFTSPTIYYRAELFVNGQTKGTLYVKNTIPDPLAAESTTLTWDLGASQPVNAAYRLNVAIAV